VNRNEFASSDKETLTDIGESFVFEAGQVLKEKQFDDEYVLVLQVGPQVDDDAMGHGHDRPYDIRYITCDERGMPFIRQDERGTNHYDTISFQDIVRPIYQFVKNVPLAYVEMVEDRDTFYRRYGSDRMLDIVNKPNKDRRTPEEKAEDEAYERERYRRAMRKAGLLGIQIKYYSTNNPTGYFSPPSDSDTSSSAMPVRIEII
jgi:hypothetical protein